MTNDGIHPTKQDVEGRQFARAMQTAIKEAGIAVDDIDYICANGSATKEGDIAETKAIKAVFGKKAYQMSISAQNLQSGIFLALPAPWMQQQLCLQWRIALCRQL